MPKGVFPRRVKRHAVTQPLDKPYRFIPLTQGQNAIVDASDYDWLRQWNWYAWWNPHTETFYAMRGQRCLGKDRTIGMHSIILGCKIGEQGDHVNHDTLNNRRENLRKCTHAQNLHNTGKHKDNKSGFKGVFWQRSMNKWIARMLVNGSRKTIGYFTSAEEAGKAYDEAARKYQGEFAYLNFPAI